MKMKKKTTKNKISKQDAKNTKQITSKPKFKFKNTLVLVLLNVIAYISLSNFLLYIPAKTMLKFGFSFSNLPALFSYPFIHIGPYHLITNLIILISLGLIAEQKLSSKDYFLIYFFAAFFSGITFCILSPDKFLVGASAAISGLMSAAFLVDIKKAFAVVIIFSLFSYAIENPITIEVEQKLNDTIEEVEELEIILNETQEKLDEAIINNNTELIIYYTETKNDTIEELIEVTEKKSNIETGIKREKSAVVSDLVHLVGALTGFAYMLLFRKDVTWQMPSQVLPQKLLRKNSKKK